MFKANAAAFLIHSDVHRHRVLIEGWVHRVEPTGCVVVFEADAMPKCGPEVTLCAEVDRRLHQQTAVVTAEQCVEGRVWIEFALLGEPVLAERRGSYRTCTRWLRPTCTVERMVACLVNDVSPDGIGVIPPRPLTAGALVEVCLDIDGIRVHEMMKVQTPKLLGDGTVRFGLHIGRKNHAARAALQRIAAYFQLEQIRRMTAAA
ncbi:MAG: hypothetical protein ACTHM6_14680 [Tepidisphaeraceae bacterium]